MIKKFKTIYKKSGAAAVTAPDFILIFYIAIELHAQYYRFNPR